MFRSSVFLPLTRFVSVFLSGNEMNFARGTRCSCSAECDPLLGSSCYSFHSTPRVPPSGFFLCSLDQKETLGIWPPDTARKSCWLPSEHGELRSNDMQRECALREQPSIEGLR